MNYLRNCEYFRIKSSEDRGSISINNSLFHLIAYVETIVTCNKEVM